MSRFILFVLALAIAAGAPPAHAAARTTEVTGVVNLNTAEEGELRKLPGIGPAKAQRILQARAKRKFDSTDQIMRVKGIGRKTYRKLKPNLAVAGPTTIARKSRVVAVEEEEPKEELPAAEKPAARLLAPKKPVVPAPAPVKSAQHGPVVRKPAS